MDTTSNNLVISVSLDSSLDLLGKFADVIVLDENPDAVVNKKYSSVYIRSHFSTPGYTPQDFREETDRLVSQVRGLNPGVTFIDDMSDVDTIVHFEDKLLQYQLFADVMPRTESYDQETDPSSFTRPIFKKRLSSRGKGVTWDEPVGVSSHDEWLIQESVTVSEEIRVYVTHGNIHPLATIRQSTSGGTAVKAVESRPLTRTELDFVAKVSGKCPDINMAGLDIVISSGGEPYLLEVNRSPGFAKFHTLTGVNLAKDLYAKRA